jgi:hypothetical protein
MTHAAKPSNLPSTTAMRTIVVFAGETRQRSPCAVNRWTGAALLLLLAIGQLAAAEPDLFPASAYRCTWANRDNLQTILNTFGATGVSLDPGMNYDSLTNNSGQSLTLSSNTKLFAINSRIGNITITAGSHDIYLGGISSGTITFQAGAPITRVILNRVTYFTVQGTGCRVDDLSWFDAYNTNLNFDCSNGGYIRNFRVIRDSNQNDTQPFAIQGNSAEPSYGNIIAVGNYLNGGSPQGPRVYMKNIGEWLSIQIGAESYYPPQNPWFSPMGVKAVRCFGTSGLVDHDHIWVTDSPSVLLVGDGQTTFYRGGPYTSTTTHVFLPGVQSKVSIDVPGGPGQWDPTHVYHQYEQCYYGATGKYESAIDNNLNIPPSPTSPYWMPQQYIGYDDEDDNDPSQVTRATLFNSGTTINKIINFNGVNAPTSISAATIQSIRATAAAPPTGLIPWNPPTYATPPSDFSGLTVQSLTAAQIQAQLDDLTHSGAVELPAGIYMINQPILMGSRSDGNRRILIGAGKDKTVLRATTSNIDLIQDKNDCPSPSSSIDIVNLTLQGGNWGINLFSKVVGSDYTQRLYTASIMSSVCIRDMSTGGLQIQNIFGMDNNAFQDVECVNCPVGWQQTGGNEASGNTWAYMDKNMWLGCQWINCPIALNFIQGGRPSGANVLMECLFTGCTTAVLPNGTHWPMYWINCDFVQNAGNPMVYNYGETFFISSRVSTNVPAATQQSFYDGYVGIFEGCLFTQTGSGTCYVIRPLDPGIAHAQNALQYNYDGRCTHFMNCTSFIPMGQWYNGSSINCSFLSPADRVAPSRVGALVYANADESEALSWSAPLPASSLSYTLLDPSQPTPRPGVLLCAHQYANPLIPIRSGIPTVTSATAATFTYTAAGSFQVTASPAATGFTAQGLPAGLAIDPVAGLISGTPTMAGSWLVPIFAANAAGSSGALLTITVLGQGAGAPVFGSVPNPITGITTATLTLPLAATGAISYSAQNLPPGLSVDATTGLLTGTPSAGGSFSGLVLAANASGTSALQLNFSIMSGTPTFSLGTGTISASIGYPLSINAGAVAAASYSATGLPPGMSISAVTGLISGTPTTVGFYQVSVQATGPGGTSTLNFSVNVTLLTAPHFGYIPNPIAGLVGVPFTMAFPATDNGTDTITYQVDTLPAGLSLQPNGVISGTPTSAGTTQSQLQAQGLAGSATASLSFSITIPVPTGTSSAPGGPGTGSAPGESGATSGTSGGCGLGVGVALLSLAGIFGFMRLRRDDGPGSSRA